MSQKIPKILTILIALVWLINGLFCKVVVLTPRHEAIVARILGSDYAHPLTILIGLSEVIMAVWVLSKFKPKLNTLAQIILVVTMNILETILVPDLLLWGHWNLLWAVTFCFIVWKNYKLTATS